MRPGFSGFNQIAYVTNDRAHAAKVFRDIYGIPSFYLMETDYPAWVEGLEGRMKLNLAFANVDGVQIELIEPLEDLGNLYGRVLTAGQDFTMSFHHVCQVVHGTLSEWDTHRKELDAAGRIITYHGDVGDNGRFVYTDDRALLGHYVEHIWFSPETARHMAESVPYFSNNLSL